MKLGAAMAATLAGLLFGAGLAISGMVNPAKVLGFLDIAGAWDPSLALVLAGAVGVNLIGYRLVLKRASPLFATRFSLPSARELDVPLLVGAALFGVGWGLVGYCPGPALAALAAGSLKVVGFVVAMIVGSLLVRMLTAR